MRTLLFGLVLIGLSVNLSAQLEWNEPPVIDYPEKGTKNHDVDYLFLDVADWGMYTAGDESVTNQEIPAKITYYTSENQKVFTSLVGIRLSGIYIRKMPQKSISVTFSKSRFGSERVNYPLFKNREYDRVDDFVIRAHGNPMNKTYFRDAMMNEALDEHTDLEYSSSRPVAVYLNGSYEGLFNLREKKDKDLVKNIHGVSKKDVEIFDLSGGKNLEPNADWEALHAFFENNSVTSKKNYDYVSELIDIDNFIDYHIAHIFYSNTDWPKANVKVWRVKGGKWRWIFFDCDRGYMPSAVDFNCLEHTTGIDQWALKRNDDKHDSRLYNASLWLRKLLENEEFKAAFILRFQDLMNVTFSTEYQRNKIDQFHAEVENEKSRQIERWKVEDKENSYQCVENLEQYQQNLNQMYAFADQRPEKQRTHLDEKFDLGGWQTVSFINENPEGGKLKINTIYVDKDYFRGSFFNDIKVVVTAIPADGYEFDGWEGTDKKESQISFMPGDLSKGVKVKFKKINQ